MWLSESWVLGLMILTLYVLETFFTKKVNPVWRVGFVSY